MRHWMYDQNSNALRHFRCDVSYVSKPVFTMSCTARIRQNAHAVSLRTISYRAAMTPPERFSTMRPLTSISHIRRPAISKACDAVDCTYGKCVDPAFSTRSRRNANVLKTKRYSTDNSYISEKYSIVLAVYISLIMRDATTAIRERVRITAKRCARHPPQ